jgi:hypothetical protein
MRDDDHDADAVEADAAAAVPARMAMTATSSVRGRCAARRRVVAMLDGDSIAFESPSPAGSCRGRFQAAKRRRAGGCWWERTDPPSRFGDNRTGGSGVSPTSAARREQPVADHHARPMRHGQRQPVRRFRTVVRKLPMCNAMLRVRHQPFAWTRQPVAVCVNLSEVAVGYLPMCNRILRSGVNQSAVAMLDATAVRAGTGECLLCGPDVAARRRVLGDRLQLDDGRRDRLQLVGGGCVCATSNCVARPCGC